MRIALKICSSFFQTCPLQYSDCLPYRAIYLESAMNVYNNLYTDCIPISYQYFSVTSKSVTTSAAFHLFFILASIIYDAENEITDSHVCDLLMHVSSNQTCAEFFKICCPRICEILKIHISIYPAEYSHSLGTRFSDLVDFQVINLVYNYKDKGCPVIADIMTEVWNGMLKIETSSAWRVFSKFHQRVLFDEFLKIDLEMQKIVNERCNNDNDMEIQQQEEKETNNESQPVPGINLCNSDQAMKLLNFTKPTIDKQPQSGVIIDCFCKIN